jgi:hypothetical protein
MQRVLSEVLTSKRPRGRVDTLGGALSIEHIELSLAGFGKAIAFMGIESTF